MMAPMLGGLESWSQANLGQWHYVLGYGVVLVSHNWPALLALTMSAVQALRAFRRPSRLQLCWLYAWLSLGVAYEYAKHIAPRFHAACDFLFIGELSSLNRLAHEVVGTGIKIALYAPVLFFVGWWAWSVSRAGQPKLAVEPEHP